jgi:hypothetical protein
MPSYKVIRSFRYEGEMIKKNSLISLDSPGELHVYLEEVKEDMPQKESSPDTTIAPPKEETPCQLPTKDWGKINRFGIFTTGYCNINCPLCSQKEFRKAHKHLSLDTAKNCISKLATHNLSPKITLTGGEPTLWPHLKEICEFVRLTLPLSEIQLYTNHRSFEIINELFANNLVDISYTSKANCNIENAENLLAIYGKEKVNISSLGHFAMPTSVAWGSLPAICHCPGLALQGEYVYACPNIFSLAERFRYDLDGNPLLKQPAESEWVTYYLEHEDKKYNCFLCQLCPSNNKIKSKIKERTKRYTEGI